MAPSWKNTEVKVLASTIRDYSVDKQVDVTDNTWKAHLTNFDGFYTTIKAANPDLE